jgi:putative membrane protein
MLERRVNSISEPARPEPENIMDLLAAWFVLALGVFIAAKLVSGVEVPDFWDAIVVAAVFGTLNFLLGWLFFIVIGIATLGIGFLLFFITRWVVNAIMLMLTASFTPRLRIRGFGTAMIASLVISVVAFAADKLLMD